MKARFEPAHRSQIQRQKIKEQRAVCLCRQRNHLAFLVLPRVIVDPLQVGGLSAQTWTVVHQLAIDFARGKIYERHLRSARSRPEFYSTGARRGPAFWSTHVTCKASHSSFCEIASFWAGYFCPVALVGNGCDFRFSTSPSALAPPVFIGDG